MSKRNISYIKPAEPSFIRKLKEQIGYKEGPSIDTKREKLPVEDDDSYDVEAEEKPVIVVLKSGDLTEEEANQYLESTDTEIEKTDKKIFFKKPEKRESSSSSKENSKKRKKDDKVKNSSLLSFDEEENDD